MNKITQQQQQQQQQQQKTSLLYRNGYSGGVPGHRPT